MIVVTGASRGLGAAICARLIESGHQVFGIARDVSALTFEGQSCDVSDYKAVKAVARQLRRDKAEVHGVINAAGIASMNLAVTTPASTTEKILGVNLAGTIYCCQLFAPLMLRRKAGSFINFSTIAVALGLKGESVYAASKAGVEGFSRAFAREMADFHINVNCIAPGPIKTDLLKGVTDEQIDDIVQQQVIPRRFVPDDVCDLVELLLDAKSSSLSGQVLAVGGV